MVTLIVTSEQEAVDVSRALTRAAKSVYLDTKLHDIEQTSIADYLCRVRDSIKIVDSEKNNKITKMITPKSEDKDG